MKKLLAVLCLSAGAALGAVNDSDWCTVEYPELWNPETEPKGFVVKVTIKDDYQVPEGMELAVYADWMKKAGYGGFAAWNAGRKPTKGKPIQFSFRMKPKEDAVSYDVRAFLAPKADWNKRVKELHSKVMLPEPPPYPEMPASIDHRKSFIWIEDPAKPVRIGDELVFRVHYYLDPSETWGPKQTKLMCCPLGPWIDNPDGVINKKRTHVNYPGLFTQDKKIEPGEGVAEFSFKLSGAYRYNSCFFLCKFKHPDGTDWPWDWRGGSLNVVPQNEGLRIFPTTRAGLFFDEEVPSIAVIWGDKAFGSLRKGTVVVKDVKNAVVLTKEVELNPARRVQLISFPELSAKGIFSANIKAPGLGKDGADIEEFCYFGRVPRFVREDGRPTPFAVTNVGDADLSALAYDLGFSYVRHFTSWNSIQPAPDRWNLASLDAAVKYNNAAGLKPWIQLYGPPAWSLPAGMPRVGQFEPAPFDLDRWGGAIAKLAERYKGQLYGFEFLNEIVPGKACEDPVKAYVDICRVGYEAAKKSDPKLVCQLAGGLWPHSYRVDVLNAGIAKYVDVLPVHYSTYEGVMEAKRDLDLRGITNVRVIDNETAKGMTVWNYPPDMAFSASLNQCRHVMTRWPDELCAGAEMITYFGGHADACGNWSYMLDLTAPRPVVATIAVVQGKLAYAKPVGKFYLGETVAHLFEKDGKAILFLATPEKENVAVNVPARDAADVTVTDFQGNVKPVGKLAGNSHGPVSVMTGDMPVIVEGADLETLKLHAALSIGLGAPSAMPQVTTTEPKVSVTVRNPYAEKRTFLVEATPVALASGAEKRFELTVKAKPGANRLSMKISTEAGAAVEKPYLLYLTDESSMGNLVKNGAFDGNGAPWKGEGSLVDAAVPGDGANRALAIAGKGKGYAHHTESVDLPVPGGTYLYSAWLRGEGMGGGSNVDEYDADGKHLKNHMMLRVFAVGGEGSKGWRYHAKKIVTTPETAKLALTPVAEGKAAKRILYDNLQLSLYKGTDFQAFASADGAKASPIPLLAENQVRAENGYQWTEKNLGGIARFTWTKDALVFEATVEDDAMDARPVVSESGEETLKGDAIALSIFPRIGPDGNPADDQLRWYLSKASPGGGSGATTVFRPKAFSMGAKDGQLCKDSSVYQVSMTREGTTTTYRLTIPWAEIPGFTPAKGASFGCNLMLTDADGGEAHGKMVWGAGLKDFANGCGVVTLVP